MKDLLWYALYLVGVPLLWFHTIVPTLAWVVNTDTGRGAGCIALLVIPVVWVSWRGRGGYR